MLTRRALMLAGTAAAAELSMGGTMSNALAAEPVRYPDPAIKVLDPRFQALILGNAAVERIATGMRFCEGPVWFGDGRYLLWSDIPNNRIMRWAEESGQVTVFRAPPRTPTATPATGTAAWSPASTTRAGSPAPSTTAPSRS